MKSKTSTAINVMDNFKRNSIMESIDSATNRFQIGGIRYSTPAICSQLCVLMQFIFHSTLTLQHRNNNLKKRTYSMGMNVGQIEYSKLTSDNVKQ